MMQPSRSSGQCAALILAMCALPAALHAQDARPTRAPTVAEDLQMFSQVFNQIRVNHPDSMDTHALFIAAVEGMVSAADPHSYVLPAARLAPDAERAWREGRLVPVPITFRMIGGAPVVVSVAPGTAASAQDILPGDELIRIGESPVTAASAMELDITLAGAKGSTVTIELERHRVDGSLVRLTRQVSRERPDDDAITGVPAAFMLDDGIGYVRVTTFAAANVERDLRDALEKLEKNALQGVVLDLRDNGGGLVSEAAGVASTFLPNGAIVYTTEGRKAALVDTMRVKRSFWRSERRYPIVLLVNEGTASAAELVAGALQDHDRAFVVGRPTFGKALMMQGFPLTDGSMVMLVVGTIRTPCGRSVQRDYQATSRRGYYRAASSSAAQVPDEQYACTTNGGRTVYGGGGIFPDVVLPPAPEPPLWLSRVNEAALPLSWAGGYVEANTAAWSEPHVLEQEQVAHVAVADFRRYAEAQGVAIPATAEADALLRATLLPRLAGIRFGRAAPYMLVKEDAEIARAVAEVRNAAALIGAQ